MRLGPLLVGHNSGSLAGNLPHVVLGRQLRDCLIHFVQFTFTTDATAVTRTPYLQALRGAVDTAFIWAAHTQAASLQYTYYISPHVSNFALSTNIRGTAAREFWLPAACELRLIINTGQAGDTHNGSSIVFQEVLQW